MLIPTIRLQPKIDARSGINRDSNHQHAVGIRRETWMRNNCSLIQERGGRETGQEQVGRRKPSGGGEEAKEQTSESVSAQNQPPAEKSKNNNNKNKKKKNISEELLQSGSSSITNSSTRSDQSD